MSGVSATLQVTWHLFRAGRPALKEAESGLDLDVATHQDADAAIKLHSLVEPVG